MYSNRACKTKDLRNGNDVVPLVTVLSETP